MYELSGGRERFKWFSKWMNDKCQPVDREKLISEAEMSAKYSELEVVFLRVEKEVREKLSAVGALVLDAGKIAKDAGLDLLRMYEATSPLERSMEKAGWNTSSWHC